MIPSINTVWARIQAYAGETFHQIRGAEFTYELHGASLLPDRTHRYIPKSNFQTALQLVPLHSTAPLQALQGPSYIYAILMDSRIRQNNW